MRTLLVTLCAAAAFAVASNSAHAGIDWSYIGDKEVKIQTGGSTISFLGTVGGAANNTGVVIFNITAGSTTDNDGPPDHFDATPFTLNVSVIDEKARTTKTGNEIGTVTFKGYFTADVTKGSLTNWAVTWEPGMDEGNVLLGNGVVGTRKYNVKIDGFLPPSPNSPEVNGRGTVHANVTIIPIEGGGDPPPEPTETPEPASLLLAGLGLSTFGAVKLRRRKQKLAN